MFAGLNVLPKTSWFSSYSDRVTREMNINFLKQLSTSEDGYNFTNSGAELTQAMLNIATEISTNKLK